MRRARKKTALAVIKWALIIAGSVSLFYIGKGAALRERGYPAIGGEAFLLFIPLMYYAIERTVKEWAVAISTLHRERERWRE